MFGTTLSIADIEGAPPHIRHWLEIEVASTLGLRPGSAAPRGGRQEHADRDSGQTQAAPDGSTTAGEVKMNPQPMTDPTIRNLIAVRAYELWENQGRPQGYDVINWHQAEHEIMSSLESRSAEPEDRRAWGQGK